MPAAPAEAPDSDQPPDIFEPPDDTESSWISGPEGTLRILERHPDGRLPVVFVHGLGGRSEHWSPLFEAAGPALRVVAFDLPGHGLSDQPSNGDFSIAATAKAIGAVLDALNMRRCVLVAHSFAAAAAIEYAAEHPRRVGGLLLVDPGGDQSRVPAAHHRELYEQLARDPGEEIPWYFRQLLTGARPAVAERVLDDLAAVPAEVVLASLAAGASYSPLEPLSRFGGPIHSVISDLNDLPYSLHRLLPDLDVSHITGSSHWLMMDRPVEVWETLLDLVEECGRASSKAPARPQ